MSTRFSLGIDLGTSNSAVAINDFESDQTAIVEITQILRPNQIGEKATLPSALYVAHPDEFPADSMRLPWVNHAGKTIVPFCPRSGALIPDRRHLREVLAVNVTRLEEGGAAMEIRYPGAKAIRF
jgi:molecular chaperone DnaK (HSP70)